MKEILIIAAIALLLILVRNVLIRKFRQRNKK